jgi:uncharacterized membrane protein
MIRFIRIVGWMLMAVGVVVILSWLIEPLRKIWPTAIDWFRSLPIAIQIGLIMAAIGFVLLFSSVVWERMEDRRTEKRICMTTRRTSCRRTG